MPPQLDQFAKGIAAIWTAGILWIADAIPVSGLPDWLMELGLPTAFLVAVAYALVSVHKALRESEAGRRNDWAEFCEKLEELQRSGSETRERLIRATDEQTREFKNLADQMKARPCQLNRIPPP